MKWTLRTFLVTVLVACAVVCFTADYFVNAPTRLDEPIIGSITSGSDTSTDPLTPEELELALARHFREGEESWTADIATATIEKQTIVIEAPRNVPLIGPAELHRVIYRCVVEGTPGNGNPDQRVFLVEKNHFHLLKNQGQ